MCIDTGAMKGVAGNDLHVVWEILLKRLDLGIFTRRLAANYGTLF